MSERWDEYTERLKFIRDEYREAVLTWRFWQGMRAAFIAAVITATVALLGTYRSFLLLAAQGNAAPMDVLILVTIPMLAIAMTALVINLEQEIERALATAVQVMWEAESGHRSYGALSSTPISNVLGDGRWGRFYKMLSVTVVYLLWIVLLITAVLVASGVLK